MSFKEKVLYHQIHPAKLATDWLIGGLFAYIFLWHHQLLLGLIVAIIPSVIASMVVIKYVNLNNYRSSVFGRYIKEYMTQLAQVARLVGAVVTGIATWYHNWALIIVGIIIVFIAWGYGIVKF